jgi:Fe-S-cluster-containing hydrogenase component 2
MARLDEHPTVMAVRARTAPPPPEALDAQWLKQLCLDCGADDAGFVSIDRTDIAEERPFIVEAFPATRTLISLVTRMSPEAIRSPARSTSNLEFHETTDHANTAARGVVKALKRAGVSALNPPAGFPMEMDRFPGRIWTVAHKPVAVAAGMGRMGVHRSVIHPEFGSFITLATVFVAAEVSEDSAPCDFNPCLECKLCVAACPVGAISPDGYFNFSACNTHNYREFLGGFADYVETVADHDAAGLRRTIKDSEQASMWQSLSFGANYKAAYCLAACPAGSDVIRPYLDDRAQFAREIVKPLQEKKEPVYVVRGTDAEEHARKRYPHKTLRYVRSGIRPRTIEGFMLGLPLVFQPGRAGGLDATYHFRFTGAETEELTVKIAARRVTLTRGLHGKADIVVTADAKAWLSFVYKERGLAGMLLSRKLRFKGPARLLRAFGDCFPS